MNNQQSASKAKEAKLYIYDHVLANKVKKVQEYTSDRNLHHERNQKTMAELHQEKRELKDKKLEMQQRNRKFWQD